MRHVVGVACEKKIVETLFELIVRRRNDVVELGYDFGIVSIALKGKNFHWFVEATDY